MQPRDCVGDVTPYFTAFGQARLYELFNTVSTLYLDFDTSSSYLGTPENGFRELPKTSSKWPLSGSG